MANEDQVETQIPEDLTEEERAHKVLVGNLDAIIGRLDKEADERVGKRDIIESRWLDDLSQYHGRYTTTLKMQLKEARKSSLYINSTRPKTNTMASRLSDMLFPTDDRNWGIQPTPVPELTVEAEQAATAAANAELAAVDDPDNQQLQAEADQAGVATREIQAQMDEAKQRARSMEEEISDNLNHSKYAAQCRQVIEDGCKLGTGIIKGPVTGDRSRASWKLYDILNPEKTITGQEYRLDDVDDPRPVYWRVNPWDYFPDMDAVNADDSEGTFERHLMNPKQLKRLSKQPGFEKKAIRELLTDGTRDTTPTYIADLRSITGAYHDNSTDRFHVWEFHGQLTLDEMRDIATLLEQEGILEDLQGMTVDPLDELEAVVWFCQGKLLKFGLHYLDSGESIYSVFNLEKDDASIFGFGIPYIMRDPQKAMASAWRALMDNAGLSSGPQIVVNESLIEPMNGIWALEPRKLWRKKAGGNKGEKPFEVFNIDSNIEQLGALIEMCKKNIDDETNLPLIAQGEQGAHITKTAQGMSLLMNSVNVIFRRIIKNWDDDITTPTIRRIYHFLMQFSPKEHIKGDYDVDARGTSVLLVREMQSQNLLLFIGNFAGHAVLGKYLKDEGLPALRNLARTMMIPADDIVKTDEEVAQDKAKAAKAEKPPDIELLKVEGQMNLKQMEIDGKLELAELERETALIKLAGESNTKLDVLYATLEDAREDRRARMEGQQAERDSKERIMAAEAAVTQREGKGGGGYF